MINTPNIIKTTLQNREINEVILHNFRLAFCAKELSMVMNLLHCDGTFFTLDKDSAEPIIYQMMFSEKKGVRNLFNIKSEYRFSFDFMPGQPVLKLIIHNKEFPPFDSESLSQNDVKKIDFEFAFDFRDGLIYEIRTPIISIDQNRLDFLMRSN